MTISKSALAAAIAAAALLAACNQQPAERENGYAPTAAVDPAARLRAMPEKELLQLAFQSAFKNGATSLTLDDTSYTFAPEGISWIGNRAVLISGGQGQECHGCAGTLAVHYLEPSGGAFKVVGAWPQAASGGSYGNPPEWKLRTDLASNPVIESEGGGTFQGYTCSAAQLVELRPDAPVTIADGIRTGYSNEGAVTDGAGESITGKIVPGTKDQSFTVAYEGSRTARVAWQRAGQGYRIQPGAPDIPDC